MIFANNAYGSVQITLSNSNFPLSVRTSRPKSTFVIFSTLVLYRILPLFCLIKASSLVANLKNPPSGYPKEALLFFILAQNHEAGICSAKLLNFFSKSGFHMTFQVLLPLYFVKNSWAVTFSRGFQRGVSFK